MPFLVELPKANITNSFGHHNSDFNPPSTRIKSKDTPENVDFENVLSFNPGFNFHREKLKKNKNMSCILILYEYQMKSKSGYFFCYHYGKKLFIKLHIFS